MALQSELFRGDAKLEAAAVSDPAHITPGSRGPHVLKIQQALVILDGASLDLDSVYGPATAAAVLVYKRQRKIINFSYQTQADNIVGKMTMAALDREMVEKERTPSGPVRIRPLTPGPSGVVGVDSLAGRSSLLLAFSGRSSVFGVGPLAKVDPNIPNATGPFTKIRLEPRTTGTLEIVNGKGGIVTCNNEPLAGGDLGTDVNQICQIFDPSDTGPILRLAPDPSGPRNSLLTIGGTVLLTSDKQTIGIDGYRPGNAFVHASNASGTSLHTIAVEVRAPKLATVPGEQTGTLTETRPGSNLISKGGQDSSVPGGFRGGRPVNPKNIPGRRKINIGGEGETPGFENYQSSLPHCQYRNNQTLTRTIFRPWTEDRDPAVFVADGSAGDICIRGVPLNRGPNNINVLKRIAGPGCRITLSGDDPSVAELKKAFPFKPLEEFPDGEIVIELP